MSRFILSKNVVELDGVRPLAARYRPGADELVVTARKGEDFGENCVFVRKNGAFERIYSAPSKRSQDSWPVLAISPDGKRIVATKDWGAKTLQVLDAEECRRLKSISLTSPPYRRACTGLPFVSFVMRREPAFLTTPREPAILLPCGSELLLCGLETGEIRKFDVDYAQYFAFLTENGEPLEGAFSYRADGSPDWGAIRWLLGESGRLELRNPTTGKSRFHRFDARDGTLWSHLLLKNRAQIFSVSDPPKKSARKIQIRSADLTGEPEEYELQFPGTADELDYSDYDDLVALGLSGGRILIWSVEDRALYGAIPTRPGAGGIRNLAFSPNASVLVAVYCDGTTVEYFYPPRPKISPNNRAVS